MPQSQSEILRAGQKAWHYARAIQDPINYFESFHSTPPILPERLLTFIRPSADSLISSSPKSHHHRFVLIFALGGKGTLSVDERFIELEEGEVILVFPFQFHHFIAFEKEVIQWLFITFELHSPHSVESLRNSPQKTSHEMIFALERMMLRLSSNHPPAPEEVAEAQLLLGLILHQLLRSPTPWKPSRIASENRQAAQLLEAVNRFLVSHLSHSFQLTELAKSIGYSESHLRSLFREHLGISLGQYISETRLRKASGMLSQRNLSISEVAERCGYSSLYSFSRSFRHATGHSPKEYQKLFSTRDPR